MRFTSDMGDLEGPPKPPGTRRRPGGAGDPVRARQAQAGAKTSGQNLAVARWGVSGEAAVAPPDI